MPGVASMAGKTDVGFFFFLGGKRRVFDFFFSHTKLPYL